MCDTYTWRRAKHIHKRQTHLLVIEDVNVRTMAAKKKSLVVSLKVLDAKTNWLAVKTAVRRVGGWCEMAASLRGRGPWRNGTFTVRSRYQAAQWRQWLRALVCDSDLWSVVTRCVLKCRLNPITNPDPVCSQSRDGINGNKSRQERKLHRRSFSLSVVQVRHRHRSEMMWRRIGWYHERGESQGASALGLYTATHIVPRSIGPTVPRPRQASSLSLKWFFTRSSETCGRTTSWWNVFAFELWMPVCLSEAFPTK
jgi:hypothetical protein